MKTKSIRTILFAVSFALSILSASAQKNKPPKNVPPGNPPKNAPFDGGITFLVGAGMAYALKMAFDTKKKSIHNENIN
ncbi:MAG: hypothetical protein JWN56_277 [Sphingobacteriales bacterium]|nr:hypothetical protein [Sphingobacteriales bacterium]